MAVAEEKGDLGGERGGWLISFFLSCPRLLRSRVWICAGGCQ